MKGFLLFLVASIFMLDLLLIKPAWADRPSFTESLDYIEITQRLNDLLTTKNNPPEGTNVDEIQQEISDLEFQKYTLETGISWGQCRNEIGKPLAVYGPKSKKSTSSYDNALYFLADGQTTEEQWDCDGVYLPGDVKVAGLETAGTPVVIKIVDGTQLVAKTNPETGEIEFNVPHLKFFKSGEVNWFIPNVSQDFITTRVANAPTNENN